MSRETNRHTILPSVVQGSRVDLSALIAVLSAAASFRVATDDESHSPAMLMCIVLCEAILVGATALTVRSSRRVKFGEHEQSVLLLILFAGFLAFQIACRWLELGMWFRGMPWEVLLIGSIRTLMQGMVILGTTAHFQRLAMLLSIFVTVFSVSLSRSTSLIWFVGLYCIPALIWLVLQDWQRFSDRLLDRESLGPRRSWILLLAPVLIVFVTAFSFADQQFLDRASGWFPSSGGEGDSDPFSRDGIGDGNALVPGEENIKSVAPIEDAPFLADDRPSLYDSFDDTYEEGKPPKKTERAVSLDPTEAKRGSERIAESQVGAKEFSTLRENRTGTRRKLDDQLSEAKFHVAGRVPLHLRTEVYDLFDGLRWYPVTNGVSKPALRFRHVDDKPWLILTDLLGDWFSDPETHVIKMIRYGSPIIPVPLHTTAVHVDRVDRPDMFCWRQPGVVQFDRSEMPALIPLRVASSTVHRDLVPEPSPLSGLAPDKQLPEIAGMETMKRLALSWTAGTSPGWAEVDAIVERLRTGFRHDRSIQISTADRMPVQRFLEYTQAGPDYLFATAAALLLRSRGYSCRVVSGYYASPDRYDRRTRLTSVFTDDLHFWVEIYCGRGTWLTLEPTPGYECLRPPRSLAQILSDACTAVGSWMAAHRILTTLLIFGAAFIAGFRVSLADAFISSLCRFPLLRPNQRLAWTFAHLERRLRWSGIGRPEHRSPAAWWSAIGVDDPAMLNLLRWVDERIFANRSSSFEAAEAESLARHLLSTQTRRKLCEHRQIIRTEDVAPPHSPSNRFSPRLA